MRYALRLACRYDGLPDVPRILEQFERNPTSVAKTMRDWIERDPSGFCHEVIPVLSQVKDGPGCRHLLWLISGSKILVRVLCDPSLLSEEAACSLAERFREIDQSFMMNLIRDLFGPDGAGGISLAEPTYGLRFLQLFGGEGNKIRLLTVVGRLIRHPNARLRSKAAAMIGKMSRHYEWIEQIQNETDDRVRANALEALWEPGIPERFRALLWESVNHRNNRVAGNALLGLYRQGESGCIPLISSISMHAQEEFRATAAWVIGETGDNRFRHHLHRLVDESSLLVRQNTLKAFQKLEKLQLAKVEALRLVFFGRAQDAARESSEASDTAARQVIRVAAVSQQGTPVETLLPTDFRIIRDASIVERYAVHKEPLPETISIAFAIPANDGGGKRLHNRWHSFFSQLFKKRRHMDCWAFQEYADPHSTQEPLPAPKLTFIRDSLQLDDFFGRPVQSNSNGGLTGIFESLLTPPPFIRDRVPARKDALHVIVVETPGSRELPRDRLEALKKNAVSGGFSVHLISSAPSTSFAELAAATNGAVLVCQGEAESWQRELLALHAALLSTYRIEFESTPGDSLPGTEIHIAVNKGPMFGELRTACMLPNEACSPSGAECRGGFGCPG